MKTVAALGLFVVGIACVTVSYMYPKMGSGGWTSEKAEKLSELQARMHDVHYQARGVGHSHGAGEPTPVEDAAKEELAELIPIREQLDAELAAAQSSQAFWPWLTYCFGVTMLIGSAGLAVLDKVGT